MKNIPFTILCMMVIASIHAQDHHASLGAENTPSFSAFTHDSRWSVIAENTLSLVNVTNPPYSFSRQDTVFRPAYNAFLQTEYRLSNRFSVMTGIGYFQTREFGTVYNIDIPDGPSSIETTKSHHYVVVPVGVKYSFGAYFIRPAIGLGINSANTRKYTYRYTGPGSPEDYVTKHKDTQDIDQVNKLTAPLFLTIGSEIPVASFKIIFGFQGFYTLNTIGKRNYNQGHAYGFGTTVGLKF